MKFNFISHYNIEEEYIHGNKSTRHNRVNHNEWKDLNETTLNAIISDEVDAPDQTVTDTFAKTEWGGYHFDDATLKKMTVYYNKRFEIYNKLKDAIKSMIANGKNDSIKIDIPPEANSIVYTYVDKLANLFVDSAVQNESYYELQCIVEGE